MTGRLILGSLLAAVVLFIWGFIFWAATPWHFLVVKGVPKEDKVREALIDSIDESGFYVLPFPSDPKKDMTEDKGFLERHQQGPLVKIFYRKEGADAMSPVILGFGFIHYFVTAFIVAALMAMSAPALRTYGKRVLFAFLIGLFAGVGVQLSSVIWFQHHWAFPLYSAVYELTGWLLAGMVLAFFVKPAPSVL